MRHLMNSSFLFAVVALVPTAPVRADDRPITGSSQPYASRLGDIMGATQLGRFKLWHAGKEKNWPLV